MNVQQLRDAIKDLDGDLPVTAWTTGDSEFTVHIATIFERAPHIKPCLYLGNDPNEWQPANEKLLHADDAEAEI
jgi:hypothetical protein